MVVIARHKMALTLISQEELVSQEAGLNFLWKVIMRMRNIQNKTGFLESTPKLVKFL